MSIHGDIESDEHDDFRSKPVWGIGVKASQFIVRRYQLAGNDLEAGGRRSGRRILLKTAFKGVVITYGDGTGIVELTKCLRLDEIMPRSRRVKNFQAAKAAVAIFFIGEP